jgi:predicted MarR family transcription regulator
MTRARAYMSQKSSSLFAFASRWSIEMTKTEYALTSDHFSRNTVRILAVSGSIR